MIAAVFVGTQTRPPLREMVHAEGRSAPAKTLTPDSNRTMDPRPA